MGDSIVRNSQTAHVRCTRTREEPDQITTDNSINYYDTPKYVADVRGGAVSKTCRRLPNEQKVPTEELETIREDNIPRVHDIYLP